MGQKIAAFFVIFFLILFVGLQFFVPHLLSGIFSSIATPFWQAEFAIGSGSLRSPGSLVAENEDLRRRLSDMEMRMGSILSVEKENEELKALFGITKTTPNIIGVISERQIFVNSSSSTSTPSLTGTNSEERRASGKILAPVLVRPPFAPYDEFVVSGGEDMGFAPGDRVYASEQVLIGTISEVLSRTSKVLLYSSPKQTHQVLVGSGNILATAVGRGGGQYSAELPRSAQVKEGDSVIVPSLWDKPFGIVNAVISDPAQPFVTVLFSPPVNIFQSRWVLISK
jgi:cell shape-determining protein MreC